MRSHQEADVSLRLASGAPGSDNPGLPLRSTAGGLYGVHERLQTEVPEASGAEGLLPWLLGLPVL